MAARLMDMGRMPNMQRLAREGVFKQIHSVYPTVSNVAWASFQTGKNPGEFGVFGFAELSPDFDLSIPNRNDLRAETIWQKMSDRGRPFVALSVPMTYPAPKVNGLVVSGFLAPKLDARAVSRPEALEKLAATEYEIDIDPAVAAKSLDRFQQDLERVNAARRRTVLALMETEEWDLFVAHVMETDRINHFMWNYQHEPQSQRGKRFLDFYSSIDSFIGELAERLEGDAKLLILSDHGFCGLRWEFQLNRWLKEQGYLDYENDPAKMFKAVRAGSKAVALVPGRVHILTEARWRGGGVRPGGYDAFRSELMDRLREIRHPETDEVVCRGVMKKEEAFVGPYVDFAPDIVIDPCDGYDLKAKLGEGPLFEHDHLDGMHTYGDALLLATAGLEEIAEADSIREAGSRLCEHFIS